jgi:hypothetical protein
MNERKKDKKIEERKTERKKNERKKTKKRCCMTLNKEYADVEKRVQGFHEYGNTFSESASNYVIYGHCFTVDSTQMTSPKKNSSFIFFAHVLLTRHS